MVGKTSEMRTIFGVIGDIAPTDASVLIQGESGTGKELVAQAIHNMSPRQAEPFIVINCSAYPATLLESELFGHEKGAFTGATHRKIGRFEQADGGTVFLDEIGEISPSAQIKLLRVLQTHQFERLGGTQTVSVDVRVISATNRDLLHEVKHGNFREDLYYRLKVIPIAVPPLRQRRNDIPPLARHFLMRFATEQGQSIKDFSSDAMRSLLDYHWPGNVRELENTIEHAVVLAKTPTIQVFDLPSSLSLPKNTDDTFLRLHLQKRGPPPPGSAGRMRLEQEKSRPASGDQPQHPISKIKKIPHQPPYDALTPHWVGMRMAPLIACFPCSELNDLQAFPFNGPGLRRCLSYWSMSPALAKLCDILAHK